MIKIRSIILFLIISTSLFAKNSYDVLGIGAPCMDILIHIDENFLEKIPGEKGGSQLIDKDTLETIMTHSQKMKKRISCGGSGANTIKGLARLGQKTSFYGKIGFDDYGQLFERSMQTIGVVPQLIKTDNRTAQVACMVTPDSLRTLRCYPGAGNDLQGSDLDPSIFEGVSLVHIEGYTLNTKGLTDTAMKLAKKNRALISFDFGSFELVRNKKIQIKQLLEDYVDIVFANEDEIQELTGKSPQESLEIMRRVCPIVVILLGDKGCLVGTKDETIFSPATKVNAIDTTGAGDFFASGFLHGLLDGRSLEECAKYGNKMGGFIVSIDGTDVAGSQWYAIRKNLPKKKIDQPKIAFLKN